MIRMGEAIAPFSECDLMEEAAKVIEADDEVNRIMLLTDEQVMAERAYPEFCHGDNPPCIGKGYCPRDPSCAE